jgi:decaprenylphospho-beta-D-erythro-pentofuranosid-2-ulose 2-reductase
MKILIAGATSAIAQETARCFAQDGAELFLVARNADRLAAIADDLKVRGAKRVETLVLDLTDLDRHQELLDTATKALGGLDGLLVAYGTLGNQKASEQNVAETLKELNTNFISIVSLLTVAANYFEQQRHGCIAAISSVAGDRGRQSLYVYGTAKGGLSVFLQGLRNRLFKSGVSVVTIKPGFVDTPMTAAVKKNPLFASPASVGKTIHRAMIKGADVVYVPWFWQFIMLIIRNIPEPIFKRLKL